MFAACEDDGGGGGGGFEEGEEGAEAVGAAEEVCGEDLGGPGG